MYGLSIDKLNKLTNKEHQAIIYSDTRCKAEWEGSCKFRDY